MTIFLQKKPITYVFLLTLGKMTSSPNVTFSKFLKNFWLNFQNTIFILGASFGIGQGFQYRL